MKLFLLFLVALVASLSSFIVHVVTVEWLPEWIGDQMQSIQVRPSWGVRYVATITSIEYGIAAVTLYSLCRQSLLRLGVVKAALLYAVLLTALHGAFIRQPLMDYIIGNPIHVVVVQNSFQWLVWVLMSFGVVFGVEAVNKFTARKSDQSATSKGEAPV